MAAPAEIPAHQRAGAGAEDELVAGVIAAAPEDRPLHGGQDIAFEGTGAGFGQSRIHGVIRQGRGAAVHLDLGGGLDAAQGADQLGSLDQAGQRGAQYLAVVIGKARRVAFEAQALAGEAKFAEQRHKVIARIGAFILGPDVDVIVVQRGGVLRLPPVGQPRHQVQIAIRREDHHLEHGKAERVIAGHPELALGGEHQHGIGPGVLYRPAGPGLAGGVFGGVEM